ncbi:MAG: hypothetical protein ACM3QZ_01790 [Solirubrobacterales bacterium]
MSESTSGEIEHRPTKRKVAYRTSWLEIKDWPQILQLQSRVLENGGSDGMTRRSASYLRALLDRWGHVIGVWVGEQLIGITAISVYRPAIVRVARIAGIPEKDRAQSVLFEFSMVHPEYVGNRLQRKMIERLAQLLQQKYQPKYVCFAVAADNQYSLNTAFGFGALVSGIQMTRNRKIILHAYRPVDENNWPQIEGAVEVPCDDFKQHCRMIRDGMVGYAMCLQDGRVVIRYGRQMNP